MSYHPPGLPFFPAAHKSHELLTSNLLESISVGALPAMALGLIAMTFSLGVGGLVGVLSVVGMGLPPAPKDDYVRSGVLSLYVLLQLANLSHCTCVCMVANTNNTPTYFTQVLCTGLMLGLSAMMVSLVVLSFVGGMVADATNAVYLCYALDRSQSMVTKPQVHEDFAKLVPPAGLVVEQPGGGVAYAPVAAMEMQGGPRAV